MKITFPASWESLPVSRSCTRCLFFTHYISSIDTIDTYIDRKKRIWVVDVNPFGEPSCPLLFEWAELAALPDLEFRFVKSDEEKLSSTKGASRGPIDVHMSSDFSKFMDICKQQMNESESEEES